MNLENMEQDQIENMGIPQDQLSDGDIEGQEAEFKANSARLVIEAVTEFLTLGTMAELNGIIQANF